MYFVAISVSSVQYVRSLRPDLFFKKNPGAAMKIKCIVAALCMGAMGVTFADDAIKDSNRQVRFVGGGRTIEYHEYDPSGQTGGNWFDSENGTLPSVGISYTAQGDALSFSDLYFYAGFDYARGKTHYDGYLQSNGVIVAPYQADSRAQMTDLELKFGKGFRFAEGKAQLTPYLGYSNHMWKRGSSRDQYSYKEVYEYQALALGLLSQYAFSPRLVASLDLSYGRTIDPSVTIEDAVDLELKSQPITTVGVSLDYKFTENWHAFAAYRMKKFKYGESAWKYAGQNSSGNAVYVMEPKSTSTFNDFSAGVGYRF